MTLQSCNIYATVNKTFRITEMRDLGESATFILIFIIHRNKQGVHIAHINEGNTLKIIIMYMDIEIT